MNKLTEFANSIVGNGTLDSSDLIDALVMAEDLEIQIKGMQHQSNSNTSFELLQASHDIKSVISKIKKSIKAVVEQEELDNIYGNQDDEDDYSQNMPCDTYGMCPGTSCSRYIECQ